MKNPWVCKYEKHVHDDYKNIFIVSLGAMINFIESPDFTMEQFRNKYKKKLSLWDNIRPEIIHLINGYKNEMTLLKYLLMPPLSSANKEQLDILNEVINGINKIKGIDNLLEELGVLLSVVDEYYCQILFLLDATLNNLYNQNKIKTMFINLKSHNELLASKLETAYGIAK